jgi:hypothetical protein
LVARSNIYWARESSQRITSPRREKERKEDTKTSYLCIVIPWRFPSILLHGTPAGYELSVIHALAAGAAAARRESQRKSKFDPCHSISAMQAARWQATTELKLYPVSFQYSMASVPFD